MDLKTDRTPEEICEHIFDEFVSCKNMLTMWNREEKRQSHTNPICDEWVIYYRGRMQGLQEELRFMGITVL